MALFGHRVSSTFLSWQQCKHNGAYKTKTSNPKILREKFRKHIVDSEFSPSALIYNQARIFKQADREKWKLMRAFKFWTKRLGLFLLGWTKKGWFQNRHVYWQLSLRDVVKRSLQAAVVKRGERGSPEVGLLQVEVWIENFVWNKSV